MIAVLGAGPHGQELASLFQPATLFDDRLTGFPSIPRVVELPYLIGAAWPAVRHQIADKVKGLAFNDGTVIFPGAQMSNARLGYHIHVGHNAVVSHGCVIGDFVTVCAGVVLAGEVSVEDDVFIGANATVIHGGIRIGRGAVIGAGAVVVDDVPAGVTVAGNPARLLKVP